MKKAPLEFWQPGDLFREITTEGTSGVYTVVENDAPNECMQFTDDCGSPRAWHYRAFRNAFPVLCTCGHSASKHQMITDAGDQFPHEQCVMYKCFCQCFEARNRMGKEFN